MKTETKFPRLIEENKKGHFPFVFQFAKGRNKTFSGNKKDPPKEVEIDFYQCKKVRTFPFYNPISKIIFPIKNEK